MELLSSQPRGTGPLGFYTKDVKHMPILGFHLASDMPAAQRMPLERLKTDSASFAAIAQLKRHPVNPFFLRAADHTDICSVPVPVRPIKP